MIEYACINTRKSIREKLHHCQRPKTWWRWCVISIIAENKPHAHQKTHLQKMRVNYTQPVHSPTIEAFTCSKVINAFKRENSCSDPFRKSSRTFASIAPKLSSRNKAWRRDMSRFSYPVSTYAWNAWDRDRCWHAHTKKKRERRDAGIFWVSQLKQARLIIKIIWLNPAIKVLFIIARPSDTKILPSSLFDECW